MEKMLVLIRVLNILGIFVEKHGEIKNVIIFTKRDFEKVKVITLIVARADQRKFFTVYQKQIFYKINLNFTYIKDKGI